MLVDLNLARTMTATELTGLARYLSVGVAAGTVAALDATEELSAAAGHDTALLLDAAHLLDPQVGVAPELAARLLARSAVVAGAAHATGLLDTGS